MPWTCKYRVSGRRGSTILLAVVLAQNGVQRDEYEQSVDGAATLQEIKDAIHAQGLVQAKAFDKAATFTGVYTETITDAEVTG